MMVLPPSALPARTVVGWLFAELWGTVLYAQSRKVYIDQLSQGSLLSLGCSPSKTHIEGALVL